jgi:hypothetical protein
MTALQRGFKRLLERLGLAKPQTVQEELRGAIDQHLKEGAVVKKGSRHAGRRARSFRARGLRRHGPIAPR